MRPLNPFFCILILACAASHLASGSCFSEDKGKGRMESVIIESGGTLLKVLDADGFVRELEYSGDSAWLSSQDGVALLRQPLEKLGRVRLSHTTVTKDMLSVFAQLKQLDFIEVSQCETDVEVGAGDALVTMSWIKSLIFQNHREMTTLQDWDFVSKLSSLEELHLFGYELGRTDIDFSSLTHLRRLSMNGISRKSLQSLAKNDSLRELDISEVIDDLSELVDALENCKELRRLEIRTSSLIDQDSLKKKFPKLEVFPTKE